MTIRRGIKLRLLMMVVVGLFCFSFAELNRAEAGYPNYILLGPPQHIIHNQRSYIPGYYQTVRPHSYAYGWFGVVRPEPRLGLVNGYYYPQRPPAQPTRRVIAVPSR